MNEQEKQGLAADYPWLSRLQGNANRIVNTLFEKEQHYAGSWQKRGGPGAFMMLARKWDRIENIAKAQNYDIFQAIEHNDGDVTDDIDDMIGYLLLVRAKCVRPDVVLAAGEGLSRGPYTLVGDGCATTSGIVAHPIEHPAPFGYDPNEEELPPPAHPKHRPLSGAGSSPASISPTTPAPAKK